MLSVWFTGRSEHAPIGRATAVSSVLMQFSVHVHPGAREAFVGGDHDGALVVRVRARAVDGAATKEVLDVVAEAFGVRGAAVQLVRGATSRRKLVRVVGEDDELERQLSLLLGSASK